MAGAGSWIIAPGRLTAGVSPDEDGPPAEKGRGAGKDGAGSMKPRWTRFRKKRKQTDPEGVLQAGLLVFSATCGATLLLAACNGG